LIWSHVFSLNASSSVYDAIAKVDYCPEALIPLFAMLRVGLHYTDEDGQPITNESHWSQNYPLMIAQLISFLYQNLENFISVCHTDTFVIALFTVLVPPRSNGTSQTPAGLSEFRAPGQQVLINIQQISAGASNRCARSILDLLSSILLNDLYLQHDETHTEWLFDSLVEVREFRILAANFGRLVSGRRRSDAQQPKRPVHGSDKHMSGEVYGIGKRFDWLPDLTST
jgi:hypothetical protein